MKRYLAVFLCLCLIGMGGFTVSAKAGTVSVYVGDTELREDGDSVTGGSGTATLTYEDGNPVLTLNNYTYSGGGYSNAAIYYNDDAPLTIRLAGTSSVTHVPDNTNYSYGFCSDDQNAAVTIEGDGSLKLYGGSSQWYSFGMHVYGSLTISGGRVEAVGDNVICSDQFVDSYGMKCNQSLTIQGGTVIATGGNVTVTGTGEACSYGIVAEGNIEITGGAVEASGGVATSSQEAISNGIKCNKTDIGAGIDYVRVKGHRSAIGGGLKNAVPGTFPASVL